MSMFKRGVFGMVPAELQPQQIAGLEQILIGYLKTTNDPLVLLNAETSIEIFKVANQFIGNDFKNWLIANYANGLGVRAMLCKIILRWIKGECGLSSVTSGIRRDLNRLDFLNGTNVKPDTLLSNVFIESSDNTKRVDFSLATNRDYYQLLAGLGPELTAHFILSLIGTRYRG